MVNAFGLNWIGNISNIYYTVPSFKMLNNNLMFMGLNVNNTKIVIFRNHNGSQVNNTPVTTLNFQ